MKEKSNQKESQLPDAANIFRLIRQILSKHVQKTAGKSLVILNDAPYPTGDLGRRLHTFVEQGGGLLNALGEHPRVVDQGLSLGLRA